MRRFIPQRPPAVSYGQLVAKLAEIEVVDSEPNIRNKLSRGKFTAVFLIQCLEAVGASSLRLSLD